MTTNMEAASMKQHDVYETVASMCKVQTQLQPIVINEYDYEDYLLNFPSFIVTFLADDCLKQEQYRAGVLSRFI